MFVVFREVSEQDAAISVMLDMLFVAGHYLRPNFGGASSTTLASRNTG
jgi:hypothetical protein